jgi:nucleotide-binding universal stress UspA family protein
MKKILTVLDGFDLSKSTIEYAIQVSKFVDAQLIGVFLEEFTYHTYSVYEVLSNAANADKELKKLNEKDQQKRDDAVLLFTQICEEASINYAVHRNKNIAIQELKHESMFADLIIMNEYETFTRFNEVPPTRFMKELLADVQCPVLVVPKKFKPIDKVIMLYDGGPSSIFAIKMFSYLFGDMDQFPVEVFTVRTKKQASIQVPDKKLMKEFIRQHFPKARFVIKKGNPEELIIDHLKNLKENELVVLGAYRRSELSRWFKTSMADLLMEKLDTPLFIAHNG